MSKMLSIKGGHTYGGLHDNPGRAYTSNTG